MRWFAVALAFVAAYIPKLVCGALVTVPNPAFELTRDSSATLISLTDGQFFRLDGTAGGGLSGGGVPYSLDNWTLLTGASNRAAVQNPVDAQFPGSTGVNDNVLVLGNLVNFHEISNTLVATLAPNTTYTLSVDVGERADFGNRGYEIAMFAGGTELDRLTSTDAGAPSIPVGSFSTIQLVVDANAFPGLLGQPLEIRLASLNQANTNSGQTAFDNVQLDATIIPEPATLLIWSLLAGLGVGLGWRRRTK
jgi:hypothetical protein